MAKKSFFIFGRKRKIYVEEEEISGSVAIFLYGLFDSIKNQHTRRIKDYLYKNNISIISFDYIGHGKSEFPLTSFTLSKMIQDSKKVFSYAEKKYNKIYLIGSSFGGYPSIYLSSINNVSGTVLLNPVSDMVSLVLSKKSEKGLSKHTKAHKGLGLLSKAIFFFDILKYNIYKMAKKIKSPVLIFHSRTDEIVPYRQSIKLKRIIGKKSDFIPLKGVGHVVDNNSVLDNVSYDIIKWILRL